MFLLVHEMFLLVHFVYLQKHEMFLRKHSVYLRKHCVFLRRQRAAMDARSVFLRLTGGFVFILGLSLAARNFRVGQNHEIAQIRVFRFIESLKVFFVTHRDDQKLCFRRVF